MIDPGETLLDFDFGNHLYIVIGLEIDGELAVANLTTHGREERCGREGCVVFQSGDHRWIRRPSCIPYRRARLTPSAPLAEMKRRGTLSQDAPFAPDHLLRVQHGALADPKTPRPVRDAVRRTLGLG